MKCLMSKIKVVLDPEQRIKYLDYLLSIDGLSNINEDVHAAYCPISLTSTPQELKSSIFSRQQCLSEKVLQPVGITAYDPSSAPYSPDKNLISQPNEIYLVDSMKIAGARYFVGHNILPSTGFGVELEKAKTFNRISVIFLDKNIRVSRMQPNRTIYLQYNNFEKQSKDFCDVFKLIKEFEPGIGFCDNIPVLLGFRNNESPIDLESTVYNEFPHLQYQYNGKEPILQLKVTNPELFYEFNNYGP